MLGGVQWNLSDPSISLHLFSGIWCRNQVNKFHECPSPSLTMASVQRNDIKNMFQHTSKKAPASIWILHLNIDASWLFDSNLFCISWTSLPKMCSTNRLCDSNVVFGSLPVELPAVIVSDVSFYYHFSRVNCGWWLAIAIGIDISDAIRDW